MPLDDTQVLDPAAPGGAETPSDVAGQAVHQPQPSAEAAPSTAGVPKADDTPSIVRDVLEKSRKLAEASPADGSVAGQTPGSISTQTDNENFSDVPFGKHPRFKELLRQRNEFKPDADRYRNVETFMKSSGITPEEGADAFQIVALAKTNPVECWRRHKPWVMQLLHAAGEILPPELESRVQRGELQPQSAAELARAQAQVRSVEAQRSFEQQRRQQEQQEQFVTSLRGAATAWEADRQAKDPNYEAKSELIQKEVLFLQRNEGVPRDPQGVTDQLNRAYAAANQAYRPPAPPGAVAVQSYARRPAVRPVTGGQAAGTPQPKPESTVDIIQAELSKRRAR